MTSPVQKTYYNTPQKFHIQDAHEYILARELLYNLRNVFEYFSVKKRTG